jgi:serine/threonine protein kinase
MMRIDAFCPTCRDPYSADFDDIGRIIVCPRCESEWIVPSKRIAPGSRYGPYEIQCPLGTGAYSEVHLAKHVRDDTPAAIKVIFLEEVEDNDLRRFSKEILRYRQLEHPSIIRTYDDGRVADRYYVAMEYVEGETLEELIEKDGAMEESEALRIAIDVALAMDYAWSTFEVTHRDIKPGNIMLAYSGEAKVMDFGIAKTTDQTKLTETQMIIGTPHYMSPEQCAPGKTLDFRADLYSLGATLYHLVSGEFPFNGVDPITIVRKQMFEKVPDPREFVPELADGTVDLIYKMMAKSTSDRHESWEAFIAEASDLLDAI